MKVGTSQVDITPPPGGELSGFAVRTQPSLGVLDPLFAKALYLEHGGEHLLWMHCDLIGFTTEFVASFRQHISKQTGLKESRIMLSATHTQRTVYDTVAGVWDTRSRIREEPAAAAH